MQFVTPLRGSLNVGRMYQPAQASRAGFYLLRQGPNEESMMVRSCIQEIALEHRLRYGYRRITMESRRGVGIAEEAIITTLRGEPT